MCEPQVWQATKMRLTYSGAPHPPDIIGIFTSPDQAFAAVRRHPLFEGVELEWEPFQYREPRAVCYVAETRLMGRRRRRVPYRVLIQPFILDELRTDWAEDLNDLLAELTEYEDSGPDRGFHQATVMLSSLLEVLPEGERGRAAREILDVIGEEFARAQRRRPLWLDSDPGQVPPSAPVRYASEEDELHSRSLELYLLTIHVPEPSRNRVGAGVVNVLRKAYERLAQPVPSWIVQIGRKGNPELP